MELYQKQIKYSLFKMVPAYGFSPDGYTDVLVEDTGWIPEEKDTWTDKDVGPYAAECSFMESVPWYTVAGAPARIKTRWVKREERYEKMDIETVVRGYNATKSNPVDEFVCSVCGCVCRDAGKYVYDEDSEDWSCCEFEFNYCPNCGAKMDKNNCPAGQDEMVLSQVHQEGEVTTANKRQLVDVNDVYSLFGANGTARLHVGDIDVLPRVDAAPVVHAHWAYWPRKVYTEDGSYTLAMDTSCSKCNWHIPEGMDSPFCPRCGARMDKNIFSTEG